MIEGKSCSAVKKELVKPIGQLRPPCVPRTLRRNDDEGKIGLLRHVRRKPLPQDRRWIIPRLTKPMQEQDGWEFLVAVALSPGGNIQQVIQTERLRDLEFPSHNLHRLSALPASASTRRLQWRLFPRHTRIVRGGCASGQAPISPARLCERKEPCQFSASRRKNCVRRDAEHPHAGRVCSPERCAANLSRCAPVLVKGSARLHEKLEGFPCAAGRMQRLRSAIHPFETAVGREELGERAECLGEKCGFLLEVRKVHVRGKIA
jgi:hypothetical protein